MNENRSGAIDHEVRQAVDIECARDGQLVVVRSANTTAGTAVLSARRTGNTDAEALHNEPRS